MKVLFIGGTGLISSACAKLALERGIELSMLNRGNNAVPEGVTQIVADVRDQAATEQVLAGKHFDVVVNWIAFTVEDVERDLALFRDRTHQYIFISSASAYQKPPTYHLFTEDTPLANPYWEYSRNKIACEERLIRAYREDGFPTVIVRPSHTYAGKNFPCALNSSKHPYTAIARMRQGKPVVVPGDGTSLWTITHTRDFAKAFVGLLGHQQTLGHAFQITSDEALTWDQIFNATARAAGTEAKIVHISTDFIVACMPDLAGPLLGDKSRTVVFDNSKVKRFVPDYVATTPFARGIEESVAWFDADASRQTIDDEFNAQLDKLIEVYQQGLDNAVKQFAK